ncbi:hypothetical protein [Streptomyces xiamenensis]
MDTMIRAAEPDELTELGELTATTYLDEGLLTYGASDPPPAFGREVPPP